MMKRIVYGIAAMAMMSIPAMAQSVDFGDDTSEYAHDGECDDMRFAGPQMATNELLSIHMFADATDCYEAWQSGGVDFAGVYTNADGTFTIEFGDDSSEWAVDGECDDPRFAGPGMTETELLFSDLMRDASDCQSAYDAGDIWLDGIEM